MQQSGREVERSAARSGTSPAIKTLLLRRGDPAQLLVGELIAALEGPMSDPLLHLRQPLGALAGVLAEIVVHVAWLAVLRVLPIIQAPHQRAGIAPAHHDHDALVVGHARAL